jgi:hypothetical protein
MLDSSAKILPGTGRGTSRRSRMVEGSRGASHSRADPSTVLRTVPLPVPGRI